MTNHKKRVQVPEFVHPTTGTEPTVWSLLNNITWYTTSMTLNLTLKLHSFLCSSNQILRIIQTTPPSSDGSNLEDFSSWKEDSMERRWNKNCVVRWYLSVDFIRHQIPCLNCRSCSCFSVSCSNKLKAWGEMFKRVKPRDLFGLFKNFVESALLCAWLWRWNENRGMFVQFGGDEGVRRYGMMWSEGGFEDDVAEAEVPWLEMSLFCSLRYTLWPQFPLFRKES